MKEVTYEEWQKNPKPRIMWVWHNDFEEREKRKVVYVIKDDFAACPVLAVSEEDASFCLYCHCAEIEEPKTRRMTHKELSRWLREKPTRERKWTFDRCICSVYDYDEQYADKEVSVDMRIREDDGEWHLPLAEVEK